MKRFVLGIGGYIGSGKTTVACLFEKLGAYRIDADQVVDSIYQPGKEGFQKIFNFFGEEYFTKKGVLNRRKLAKVVFEDPKKLKILNGLIHPLVTTEVQKLIDKSGATFVVLEATYFEKKFLRNLVSAILWVDCKKNLAYQRLSESRKMTREMYEKILRLQVQPQEIDFIMENNGSVDDLKSKVPQLWVKLGHK